MLVDIEGELPPVQAPTPAARRTPEPVAAVVPAAEAEDAAVPEPDAQAAQSSVVKVVKKKKKEGMGTTGTRKGKKKASGGSEAVSGAASPVDSRAVV